MEEDHLASRSQETADRGQDMDTQEADRANKVTAWGSVVNKNILNLISLRPLRPATSPRMLAWDRRVSPPWCCPSCRGRGRGWAGR